MHFKKAPGVHLHPSTMFVRLCKKSSALNAGIAFITNKAHHCPLLLRALKPRQYTYGRGETLTDLDAEATASCKFKSR